MAVKKSAKVTAATKSSGKTPASSATKGKKGKVSPQEALEAAKAQAAADYAARPFACDSCAKRFVRKADLTRHKLVHTTDGDYICGTCGKCERQESNLRIHERTHTGEKPLICDTPIRATKRRPARKCKEAFATNAARLRHKMDVHGYVPAPRAPRNGVVSEMNFLERLKSKTQTTMEAKSTTKAKSTKKPNVATEVKASAQKKVRRAKAKASTSTAPRDATESIPLPSIPSPQEFAGSTSISTIPDNFAELAVEPLALEKYARVLMSYGETGRRNGIQAAMSESSTPSLSGLPSPHSSSTPGPSTPLDSTPNPIALHAWGARGIHQGYLWLGANCGLDLEPKATTSILDEYAPSLRSTWSPDDV